MITPRVSVLLPVWNGEKFLARAIESVRRQAFKEWELIIIDDGSTDQSKALGEAFAAEDPRIRLISQANTGIQKALNYGLGRAYGEYIARIDDDDAWLDPAKLKKQVEFLDSHPDHLLVGTGAIVQDEAGSELFRYTLPCNDGDIRRRILYRNCFIHSSVLFRTASVRELGGYPESRETSHVEDYALWLELGTKGKFANLDAYAIGFTLRPGTLSARNKLDQFRKDVALIYKYRRAYPGYWPARAGASARLFGYGLFRIFPESFRSIILRWYKEF